MANRFTPVENTRCKIEGANCSPKYHAKDLCQRHYQQLKIHGRITHLGRYKWSDEHRSKVKGRTLNTGRTHFKKGFTPWNKGKEVLSMRGENHPRWKGNTEESYRERRRFRVTLQSKIFKRDNYTCQICDQYSGNLQVDHTKSWKDYPELRFEESNCRTLCMACHYYITFKRKLPKGVVWGHNFSRRIAS